MEQEKAEKQRLKEEEERKRKREEKQRMKRMLEAAFDGDVEEMTLVLKEVKFNLFMILCQFSTPCGHILAVCQAFLYNLPQ